MIHRIDPSVRCAFRCSAPSSPRGAILWGTALLVWSAGCYPHISKSHHDGPVVVYESEINDDANLADFIGYVRPGDAFVVEGDLGFGGDPQDGFSFVAEVGVQIEYALYVHDSASAFGICVYDPYYDQIVFCDTSGANPELGAFYVDTYDTEFHVVVVPLYGAASYSLSIDVFPLGSAPTSAPPSADAPAARLTPRSSEAGDPSAVEHDDALFERAQSYLRARSAAAEADFETAPRHFGELVIVDDLGVRRIPLMARSLPGSPGSPDALSP